MSDFYPLRRRDVHQTWARVVFGLIIVGMVLTLLVLPRGTRQTARGVRGPTVRPQSDTQPLPPPSLARTRSLAV